MLLNRKSEEPCDCYMGEIIGYEVFYQLRGVLSAASQYMTKKQAAVLIIDCI